MHSALTVEVFFLRTCDMCRYFAGVAGGVVVVVVVASPHAVDSPITRMTYEANVGSTIYPIYP